MLYSKLTGAILTGLLLAAVTVTVVPAAPPRTPATARESTQLEGHTSDSEDALVRPGGPRLLLRAGAFDPLTGEPPAPARLRRESTPGQPGLHLLQFPGPIQDTWHQAMKRSGLKVVTYVPNYGYLVWGDEVALARLSRTAPLRWSGAYHPFYALHPDLAELEQDAATVDVVVQVYDHAGAEQTVQAILNKASEVLRAPRTVLIYRNLEVRVDAAQLSWLASLPDVVNVEPRPERQLMDEVTGQIIAGHLNAAGTQPSGPGYLAWLTDTVGLTTTTDLYPVVDVIDDGFDNGIAASPAHPDFYEFGDPAGSSRIHWAVDYTGDGPEGTDGHGTINVSIVGGYNDETGPLYTDGAGYHYGLGINPFGPIGSRRVFGDGGGWNAGGLSDSQIAQQAYQAGARITSNSWGASVYGDYTALDQEWDAITRDADSDAPGNQELINVFAAGNDGPGGGTVTSPGNAKNVITVGAAESYRPTWTDGCGIGGSGADSAQDMASFSGRGPTSDGRVKPDLVAPGTHVQGAASQDGSYTGYGVCDPYHPAGQTLYAASSGTSHSTPVAAGAASLIYRYYQEHFDGAPPSPAMVKAYLINTTRYLTGAGAGGTLPSDDQGYGEILLGLAFDGTPQIVVDQEEAFDTSGEAFELEGIVSHTDRPLRITLAWTDAPGPTIGAAYVNDLDLEVTVGGQAYKGNVFSGATSVTGGSADRYNNVESVFLPPGESGRFSIRVSAANVAGDGVPGNVDPTDQDFALIVYNGEYAFGRLEGAVYDGMTGSPLPEVTVRAVTGAVVYTGTTTSDGSYAMTVVSDTYTLEAWKYGYAYQTITGVAVTGGATATRPITLTQTLPYTLTGCVTDSVTDAPLSATVSALGPFGRLITHTATSSATGCYVLPLHGGFYTVTAKARLHQTGETALDLVTDTVQHFSLEAATTDGILWGKIASLETGYPLKEATVRVTPGLTGTQSSVDGSYEMQLPPGAYTVTVSAPLYGAVVETNVIVPQSNLVERNYALPAAHVALSPSTGLSVTLLQGERLTQALVISNVGSVDLAFSVLESLGENANAITDSFGYALLHSADGAGAAFAWIDATDGTPLSLSDEGEANVILPFAFNFYGVESTALRVGNNGGVLFDAASGDLPYNNAPLNETPLANLIAPFWDDIDDSAGDVFYKTIGEAPNRRFVVEWYGRPHYDDMGDVTFELVLYEGTNDVKFQYQDVIFGYDKWDYGAKWNYGAGATVGIRQSGSDYLQYAHNAPVLTDGLSLCFQYPGSPPCDPVDVPWMTTNLTEGTVAVESSQAVEVEFDASAVAEAGVYTGVLRLLTNDPQAQPYARYPITMSVVGCAVAMTPPTAAREAHPGDSVTYTLTVTNACPQGDTFDVAASGNAWPTRISRDTLTLDTESGIELEVEVEVPDDAPFKARDAVTVTVHSQSYAAKSAKATLTTQTFSREVYLPLVMRDEPHLGQTAQ